MRAKKPLTALVVGLALGGCASAGGTSRDPLEPLNRAVFSFNEMVDETVLQPVARGYRAVVPAFARTGVTNFFSNLDDLWIGVNNLLQAKIADGLQDFERFTFNSTVGILGLIDVASAMDIPKHNEDFGQTAGRWGAGTGPYLVLPIFGPSDLRDALGFSVDSTADIVRNLDNVPARNSLYATRAVNIRTNLLDATRVVEEAALDKYRFVRDAYLQRRRNLVYDGNPPRSKEDMPDDDVMPGHGSSSAMPAKRPKRSDQATCGGSRPGHAADGA
jgi:phospholipid-binding lipoprotein MlaA